MERLLLVLSIVAASVHCANGQQRNPAPDPTSTSEPASTGGPTSSSTPTSTSASFSGGATTPPNSNKLSKRVRFDAYHTNTWLETLPHPELNQYHLLHGLARAASCIDRIDCSVETQIQPWDDKSLQGVDAIVLDLASADRPPFLVSEIQALTRYVENGGGLLVVVDHTNCYFHNHVLGPLFEQIGVKLSASTACDRKPQTLSDGNGWIAINSFSAHPVVESLECVAFQSGGCVDEQYGIARTSNKGWGDWARVPMYGNGSSLGFYGDFAQQPAEPAGQQSVIAAKSLGDGRIVIIGDQNAIGGMFLNYADNRRLWLQSLRWLTKHKTEHTPAQEQEELFNAAEPNRTLVWCWEDLHNHDFHFGNDDAKGLYHWFGWLNKVADARATDRKLTTASIAIAPHEKMLQQDSWRQQATSFLQAANSTLIVLCEESPQKPFDPEIAKSWKREASPEIENAEQWVGPNNNVLLYVFNRNRFTNANFESPEKWPQSKTMKLQSDLGDFLKSRGATLVVPPGNEDSWLEELDHIDDIAPANENGKGSAHN